MIDIPDSHIQICLFSLEPVIKWEGEVISITRKDALNLLVYAADQGESAYEREKFAIEVLGEESKSKRFRDALSILNKVFREIGFDQKVLYGQGQLAFEQSIVWVDTHEFTDRAKNVLAESSQEVSARSIQEMIDIIGLYQYHFLQDYTFETHNLSYWKESRQAELAALYHNVLEQLIRSCIVQGSINQAQEYAEKWLESIDPGFLPLQYLIWIGIKKQQYAIVQRYLLLLKEEEEDPTFFGVNVEVWRELLQNEEDPPLSLLRINSVNSLTAQQETEPADSDDFDNRVHALYEILRNPNSPSVIGLTGLPGAGKTQFARQFVQSLRKIHPEFKIARIELSPNTDFEVILNQIILQFQFQQLTALPYSSKQTRFKQLTQGFRCLVVIDEGTSQLFMDAEYLETLFSLFENVQLVLVARQIRGSNYYPFELTGLDVEQVGQFLTDQSIVFDDSHLELLETIVQTTGGFPMTLRWMVGFTIDQRFQIKTFLKALSKLQMIEWNFNSAIDNYAYILDWLWLQLMTDEKNILYTVSMFDPVYGVTLDDIAAISDSAFVLPGDRLQQKLDQLVTLNLLEIQHVAGSEQRYTLHPITYSYIQQLPSELLQIQAIRQAYIQYFFEYILKHVNDFMNLDKYLTNIIWMFEMVLLPDSTQAHFDIEIISLLNQLYDYFTRRGLHSKTERLLSHALSIDAISDVEHVKLLHNLGQSLFKQGQLDKAEQHFNEAYNLAKQADFSDIYGYILRDLGRVYLHRGNYDKARSYIEDGLQIVDSQQFILWGQLIANLGTIAENQGHYDEARDYFEQLTAKMELQDEHTASTYDFQYLSQFIQSALGLLAIQTKDYQEAESYLQNSLYLAKNLDNPERIAIAYLNLGVLNYHQTNFDAALDYFVQGMVVAEYIHHHDLLIWFTWNKGAVYVVRREYIQAKKQLQTALNQANRLGVKSMIPYVFVWFGILYFCQLQMEQAIRYFALVFGESALNPWFVALALYGIGLTTRYENDLAMQDDLHEAKQQIQDVMANLSVEIQTISEVTVAELERAENYFQVALFDMPGLEGYHVVEALEGWLMD